MEKKLTLSCIFCEGEMELLAQDDNVVTVGCKNCGIIIVSKFTPVTPIPSPKADPKLN